MSRWRALSNSWILLQGTEYTKKQGKHGNICRRKVLTLASGVQGFLHSLFVFFSLPLLS